MSARASAHLNALLPAAIIRRIDCPQRFERDLARYGDMSDAELVGVAEVCLKNLERVDAEEATADADLRLVLVPEICERLVPGTRTRLRRVTSGLAEYPSRQPTGLGSFFVRSRPEAAARLRAAADDLRLRVSRATSASVRELVEQVRFAIAGSRAADRWNPSDYVYEPGFAYRVVPVLAVRVLGREAK